MGRSLLYRGFMAFIPAEERLYFRCYADFARVGGRQQVSLADECIDYATIIHELMHVIGTSSGQLNQ